MGYLAVADELAALDGARILVGRTDRRTLEEVVRGVQQAEALRAQNDVRSGGGPGAPVVP